MPKVRTPCPTAQQLTDYGLGKLPAADLSAIHEHLAHCPRCRKKAADEPPDSFVGQPRTAAQRGATTSLSRRPSPAAKVPDDLPPELSGSSKFQVVGKLGEGGMGAVYKARHTFLGDLVAIKVMNAASLSNPEARSRFLREMKSVGQLKHENIVRALDAEQIGELLVLVMEYVEGITLDRLVAQKGTLPVAFSCHCIAQAALGLQYAHEKGMVHRDVKPANLIVTVKEKKVKVLDFGLARGPREQKTSDNKTQVGAIMGTPAYMAPEQASDASSADVRADVYSLGCTLYFLLAGRSPFQRETPLGTLMAQVEAQAQPLPTVRPDVSAELWAVVAKMLAKKPEDRYQTPKEVEQALRPFVVGGAKGARPASGSGGAALTDAVTVMPGEGSQLKPLSAPSRTLTQLADAPGSPATSRRGAKRMVWAACVAAGLLVTAGLAAVVLTLKTPGKGEHIRVQVEPNPAATPAPPAPAEGFVSLFNGKDLTGWTPHRSSAARWDVKDGVLTGSGALGYLYHTDKRFDNFHLRVEVRINDGGDGAVWFRGGFNLALPHPHPTGGYAALIHSTHKDPNKTGSLFLNGRGWVVDLMSPAAAGEWCTQEVIADGPHIVVKVNGRVTADYIDAGPNPRLGHFALRVLDAATTVGFRKIEVKELPPGDLRLQWVHGRGVFEQVKGNIWLERFPTGWNYYREEVRSQEVVRLLTNDLQNTRPMWVDLHRTICGVKVGGGRWNRGPYLDGRWQLLQRPAPPPQRSPAARVGEWVPLFNGKDLTGWQNAAANGKATWAFEGGDLVARSSGPPDGLFHTLRADYDNFHLRMETLLGDSPALTGLLIRCGPPVEGAGGNRSYFIATSGKTGSAVVTAGSLFLFAVQYTMLPLATASATPLKSGEWVSLEVIAEGNRLRVLVKGNTVLDYTDTNATFTVGRLVLGCLVNGVAKYRKIEIKELAAAPAK